MGIESVTVQGFLTSDGFFTNKIDKGTTQALAFTYAPITASIKTVSWSSSNKAVAQIDASTGMVSAMNEGTAKITCAVTDTYGTTVSATYDIEVVSSGTQVTGIAFRKHLYCLNEDEAVGTLESASQIKFVTPNTPTLSWLSYDVELEVSPASAEYDPKDIVWTIDDPSVARVNNGGTVEGLREGTTRITATLGNYTASQEIRVRTSVVPEKLSRSDISIFVGESISIKPNITWPSSFSDTDRGGYTINYEITDYSSPSPFVYYKDGVAWADMSYYNTGGNGSAEIYGRAEGQRRVKCYLSKDNDSDNPFFWYNYDDNLYTYFTIKITENPYQNSELVVHPHDNEPNMFWVSFDVYSNGNTTSTDVTTTCKVTSSDSRITCTLTGDMNRPWLAVACPFAGENVGTITVTYDEYSLTLSVSRIKDVVYVN